MKYIREKVIQFLISKLGGYLVVGITAGVAAGVTWIVNKVPALAGQIDQQAVAGFIWVVLMSLVNYATNNWLTKDAKAVQAALNRVGADLQVDGWVGDNTVKALVQETGLQVLKTEAVKP